MNDEETRRERREASRQARATRLRTIRRRIYSGALALFVAAWLLIAVVLISGHDPALAHKSSRSGTSTSASQSSSSGISTTGWSDGTSGGAQSSSSPSSSGATSSVTTQQS